MPPDYCPSCGAAVPSHARACPECGADEQTGWSDRAHADRLGIPDEDFDYDDYVQEEFGGKSNAPIKPHGITWLWWVVALGLVLLLFSWWLR
jgi:zinc-ribbon domain